MSVSSRLLGLVGNGRDQGTGQELGQEPGDGRDGDRAEHHQRGEGASESVSSPLLNSTSSTLLGQTLDQSLLTQQTRRNCSALPVGVSFPVIYKTTHARSHLQGIFHQKVTQGAEPSRSFESNDL